MNDKTHAYFHIETPTTRFEKSVMLATEDIQHFLKIKKTDKKYYRYRRFCTNDIATILDCYNKIAE